MYQIEKNVQIHGETPKNGRPAKYPLKDLGVGDSFLVPQKRVDDLRQSIKWAESTTRARFLARQIGPDVRVWRTE